jgi:hypothetical protein
MKHTLFIAVVTAAALQSTFVSAQEAPTRWAPIEQSMTTLLNEGWRINSHTNAQEAGQFNSFSFVLSKESKVVICLVDNPQPNKAISRCRALN